MDAAAARWGGARADWLDLSTGINPEPYPLPEICAQDWTALPDEARPEAAYLWYSLLLTHDDTCECEVEYRDGVVRQMTEEQFHEAEALLQLLKDQLGIRR